jgi:uncharacterized protein YecE (DUF72 family)
MIWPLVCNSGFMTKAGRTYFFCGTSGLVLPVPNKAAFPEAYRSGTRLTYYSSLFNSIEINSSFYKIPQRATMERWAEEVTETFRFTVKLWRGITHERDLSFDPKALSTFMQATGGLGRKKGCLLVQLPPGLRVEKANKLQELLEAIANADPSRTWNLAVECRHRSWYAEETRELLRRHGAALVLQDMPTSSSWAEFGGGNFVYLRYHGPAGDYKGGYEDGRLSQDAANIQRWLAEKKAVYAYFNNTIGDALIDLKRLRELVLFPVA